MLLAQVYLFLHGLLDDTRVKTHATAIDLALTNMQFLLGDGDDLFCTTGAGREATQSCPWCPHRSSPRSARVLTLVEVYRAFIIEDVDDPFHFGLRGAHRHQSAAAANALSIGMGIILVDAGIDQRARKPANGCSGTGAHEGGHEPPGGHHGAETRNGEHAKAGKKAGTTTSQGADRGACASTLADVIITLLFLSKVRLACDE